MRRASERAPRAKSVKTRGETHVALAVKDPARSAAFYAAVFDCRVVYRSPDFVQVQTPGSRPGASQGFTVRRVQEDRAPTFWRRAQRLLA